MNLLSSIFAIATAARNQLYDRGALPARKLSRPVISVGSISAGGAGKTPFVILLGELLKQRGTPFDVLSRGYGRETKGSQVVDPSGSPRDFGDEPVLIARRLECPVIVGEDRYQAGILAERKYDSGFHILDDGFQHRSLAREFDIVLLTAKDLRDELLPTGRLREPLSALRRADAVVITQDMDASGIPNGKFVWRIRRTISVQDVPNRPIAFCGIARPRSFIGQLQAAGIQSVAEKFFRDHHKYDSSDVRALLELRSRHRAEDFVTTEKDAINLGPLANELAPLAIARVQVELSNAAEALATMMRLIAQRRTGHEKISEQ